MTQTNTAEAAPQSQTLLFMIGRDGCGNWVAQDLKRTCGGLFVSREAALRYVRAENGHQTRPVLMVPGVLELDMHHDDVAPLPLSAEPQLKLRIG